LAGWGVLVIRAAMVIIRIVKFQGFLLTEDDHLARVLLLLLPLTV
jgi:hypothetical protein